MSWRLRSASRRRTHPEANLSHAGMLHSFSCEAECCVLLGLWSQTTGRLLPSRASGGLEGRRWAWHAPGGGMSAVLASHRWSSPTRPAHTHAHHAQTNVASSTKNIGLPRRARRAGGNSVSRRSDRADERLEPRARCHDKHGRFGRFGRRFFRTDNVNAYPSGAFMNPSLAAVSAFGMRALEILQ